MNTMTYCRNSLSDEDISAMLNTVEPSQQFIDPCNKQQSFEDISTIFLNDPINNVLYESETAATSGLDAFGIPLLSQDLSVNSSKMSQGSMASISSKNLVNVSNLIRIVFFFKIQDLSSASHLFLQNLFSRGFFFFLFMKPRTSITESWVLFPDVAKAKILEAEVLYELEAALSRVSFILTW
jgi:hypothetical protein